MNTEDHTIMKFCDLSLHNLFDFIMIEQWICYIVRIIIEFLAKFDVTVTIFHFVSNSSNLNISFKLIALSL